MLKYSSTQQLKQIGERFSRLYGGPAEPYLERLDMMIGRYGVGTDHHHPYRYWDQADSVLITYGDMVHRTGESPLAALKSFLDDRLRGAVSTVHILPFFPYSSDDGFSVIDYREVDPDLGTWDDVERLSENFSIMADLVLNHVSRESSWFRDYVSGIAPECNYFIEVDPHADLSSVVRPRSTPVLTPTQTRDGERHVWTTFSEDQVDLDFANPDVLFEFIDILFFYISKGTRIVRLDAIAYLWKKLGTSCIHLPETHEVVKLFRDILDLAAPEVSILTETNVPHEENISYFGDGDEAHIVYQFTLPPLLMHALLSENASHLTRWAMELSPPPTGCTYLNFTASHDGIGVRPLEGLLTQKQLDATLKHVKERGGFISTKSNSDGSKSPYELNITYFDILRTEQDANSDLQIARFLCSQAIALSLQGIPALYFNSLIAGKNYTDGVERTGRSRTINRQKWDADELLAQLDVEDSERAVVFKKYVQLLTLRSQHPAFHPNAAQTVLDLGPALFALERAAPDDSERVVCIFNMTAKQKEVRLASIPSICDASKWRNVIRGKALSAKQKAFKLRPFEICWLARTSHD